MFDVKHNPDIMDIEVDNSKAERAGDINQTCTNYSGMVHSKKVIKHALRQQAKRRRKNTTIASGNSRALPQIVVKPLAPPPAPPPVSSPVLVNDQQTSIQHNNTVEEPAATMREVLASLPGFSLKSIRRRSTKKLSAAAQLEAGLVDLESPASILSSTSLRALLNRHTFQGLPPLYQRKLAQLLPSVDRQDAATSGLNNEFFARACLEWRKRLAEGEFTPENQQRLKMEAEKDKNKLDPWKLKHFEPIWGDKREPKLRLGLHCIDPKTTTTTTSAPPATPHGGAVTRSSLRLRLESNNETNQLINTNKLLFTRKNIIEKPETDIETELNLTTNIDVIKLNNENESQCNDELINDKLLNPINNIELTNETDKMEIDDNQVKIDDKLLNDEIDNSKVININNSIDYQEKIDNELFVTQLDDTIKNNEQAIDDCLTINLNNDIKLPDNEQFDEHYDSPKNDKLYINDDNIDLSSSDIKNDLIIDDNNIIDVQINDEIGASVDENVPIPDGMEIDSETLKRIHELEVRGEMREAYEEISGCNEEIIYPILEGMDIVSNCSEENEPQNCTEQNEDLGENLAVGNDDEELRDANNYVCSEMLDCSWSVDQDAGGGGTDGGTGDIQVPWPLVAAALDGSVAANITVETQEDCTDAAAAEANVQQFESTGENACVSLPQPNQYQETMTLSAPANNCLLKNVQAQNSPIIAFPPLQSIRFVPRFHQNNAAGLARVNQPVANNIRIGGNGLRTGQQPVPVVQGQQSAIVVQQHQTGINVPVTQRQIVASVPQAFNGTNSRSRSSGQGYRAARNGGKEQGGRSRSSTKEPPGAVNLERSYQICQAVIQSSPNRDQLKAHLKPPPSLLARGDGAFTTSKSGGRTITTVKSQKQSIQQNKPQQQSKTQTVMLRQVFTTTRPQQIDVNDVNNTTTAVAQIGTVTGNGATNFGQYILVQRTGVSDCAPRASSAPPLPPQIAGLGVGVHLVRGRPASAGEGSHHAVTLKARGINDARGGGAEPSAPGVIMGGDPPPPCECQMRGAMVICRQCGAFCHDDCIGPQRICATCLIR